MKKTLALSVCLALLGSLSAQYVDDFEEHCPTIMEIYGVCSPELVENWLIQTGQTPSPPISPQAIEVVKPVEAQPPNEPYLETSTQPTPEQTPSGITLPLPPGPGQPNTGAELVITGPDSGTVIINEATKEEQEPEIWYRNMIWMVS